MRKLALGTTVALVTLTLACGSAAANGGQPDPSFGSGGRVAPEVSPAVLSRAVDGTLFLTGSARVIGTDPNSQLPHEWSTFGLQWLGDDGSGQRTVVSRDGLRFGESIAATATATDSAGRVWIAGGDRGDGYSFPQEVVVERRLADGALDATFGDGGVVHVSAGLPNVINEVVALLVQPEGRAVVVTKTGRLFRLNPDGALDSAFGIVNPGAQGLTDGFLDGRGRIVVAGGFDDPSASESSLAGLAILDADGHPGPRFTLPGRGATAGRSHSARRPRHDDPRIANPLQGRPPSRHRPLAHGHADDPVARFSAPALGALTSGRRPGRVWGTRADGLLPPDF